MINLRIGDQANFKAHGIYADAEFNIFTQPGNNKAACLFPHLPRYAHIKTARMKLPDGLFYCRVCRRW